MPDFQLVEPSAFKSAQDRAGLGIRKGFAGVTKEINLDARTVDFVISTGAVDRDGDTIDPTGWDLSNYLKNPVVLFAHDNRQPPVARATRVEIRDGALRSTAQFADRDTYDFADTIFRLIAGGYLNATSVGFIPMEFSFSDDGGRGTFAMDISKQELWEYSVVPIPSNPEALIDARSKGIDTVPLLRWAEQVMDEGAPQEGEAREVWQALRKSQGLILSLTKQMQLAAANLAAQEAQAKEAEAEAAPETAAVEPAPEAPAEPDDKGAKPGSEPAATEQNDNEDEARVARLRSMAARLRRAKVLVP